MKCVFTFYVRYCTLHYVVVKYTLGKTMFYFSLVFTTLHHFVRRKKYLKIDFDYDSVLRSYFCAGFWIWMKSLKGKNLYWSVFLTNNNKRRKNAYSVVGVVAFNVFFFLSPYSKSQTQAISLRKNLIKSIFLVNLLEILRLIRTPN